MYKNEVSNFAKLFKRFRIAHRNRCRRSPFGIYVSIPESFKRTQMNTFYPSNGLENYQKYIHKNILHINLTYGTVVTWVPQRERALEKQNIFSLESNPWYFVVHHSLVCLQRGCMSVQTRATGHQSPKCKTKMINITESQLNDSKNHEHTNCHLFTFQRFQLFETKFDSILL